MRIDKMALENSRHEYQARTATSEGSFQSIMKQAANTAAESAPTSSRQVTAAWNATKHETGIDPLSMNKISTAMVLYVENGRQGSFSSFLGSSTTSAAQMAEQIIYRLQHPLSPVTDVQFARDELAFYQRFLEKLV